MSVRLARDDFKKLVNILRTYAGFANVRDRRRHRWLSERQFLPGGNETLEEHYTEPGRRKALFLKIREALRKRAELIRQG